MNSLIFGQHKKGIRLVKHIIKKINNNSFEYVIKCVICQEVVLLLCIFRLKSPSRIRYTVYIYRVFMLPHMSGAINKSQKLLLMSSLTN